MSHYPYITMVLLCMYSFFCFYFSPCWIISNSHVCLLTQCSQCLGINLFLAQFQPSIWNRWIPLFQSEHAPCAPYVPNVWGPCVALYSLLMLFVSLEALQGLELVACGGEQHLSKQGNGVFSTCTPAAVVAAGVINKCWDETECLGVFFSCWPCITISAFPGTAF